MAPSSGRQTAARRGRRRPGHCNLGSSRAIPGYLRSEVGSVLVIVRVRRDPDTQRAVCPAEGDGERRGAGRADRVVAHVEEAEGAAPRFAGSSWPEIGREMAVSSSRGPGGRGAVARRRRGAARPCPSCRSSEGRASAAGTHLCRAAVGADPTSCGRGFAAAAARAARQRGGECGGDRISHRLALLAEVEAGQARVWTGESRHQRGTAWRGQQKRQLRDAGEHTAEEAVAEGGKCAVGSPTRA